MKRSRGRIFQHLQYFEAVSRHLSVTEAAVELGVTPGAVSHQIRELTDHLGEKLIAKSGRGIALTATGKKLADKLISAFADVENLLADVVGEGASSVRLAVCSSFAPGWLITRLSDFMSRNPDIVLQLHLYAQPPQLTDQVGDAFVTTFNGHPGFWSLHLMSEVLVAVHAPRPTNDAAFASLPLITTDLAPGNVARDWIDYCTLTGLPSKVAEPGSLLMCSHYLLALEMARCGLGIALIPEFLAERDLAAGILKLLQPTRMPANRDYYLCIKAARLDEGALCALVDWFRGQFHAN